MRTISSRRCDAVIDEGVRGATVQSRRLGRVLNTEQEGHSRTMALFTFAALRCDEESGTIALSAREYKTLPIEGQNDPHFT